MGKPMVATPRVFADLLTGEQYPGAHSLVIGPQSSKMVLNCARAGVSGPGTNARSRKENEEKP